MTVLFKHLPTKPLHQLGGEQSGQSELGRESLLEKTMTPKMPIMEQESRSKLRVSALQKIQ